MLENYLHRQQLGLLVAHQRNMLDTVQMIVSGMMLVIKALMLPSIA